MPGCVSCGASLRLVHQRCPVCDAAVHIAELPALDGGIGRSIPGGYVLVGLLAAGATGRVYAAEQQTLARTVAVKIVPAALVGDEPRANRLLAEIRHASRLEHPNAVRVLDMGTAGRGDVFVVMELLRGRTLASFLRRDEHASAARLATILGSALEALAEAHRLGIAHGHLGAGSVLIETRRSGEDDVRVTGFGQGALYPAARGDVAADPIADVDAMGQLLSEVLPDEARSAADRALADVARRAISIDPRERFVTANELREALRSVAEEHPRQTIAPRLTETPQPPEAAMQCPSCGTIVPGLRFCGGCGIRLPVRSLLPAAPVRSPLPLPMVGRREDVAWLEDRRAEVRGSLVGARLVGEAGAGKTRLVRDLAERARQDGDWVIELGPDPRDAEVAHFAVREAILALAFESATEARAGRWDDASADAKLGLEEIVNGLTSQGDARTPDERRHAAAEALRWALLRAVKRKPETKLLVVVEDLDRVDWPSRAAIADALGEPPDVAGLVLATHVPGFEAGWQAASPARVLGGLPAEEVVRLLPASRDGEKWRARTDAAGRGVLPLYVEHALRLHLDGGGEPPPRLGDLLARRIERLDPADRAVLQALSVLGDDAGERATLALLPGLSDFTIRLDRLEGAGMIDHEEPRLRVAHPMLREIVLAHIPASVRRDLHERARRLLDSPDVPLEVRALHAHDAGHAPAALRLLRQVAERARGRGDFGSAVAAFRRAWRLSRRNAQPTADAATAKTTLGLAIDLSAMLLMTGGFSEIDRVLADMSQFTSWRDPERAALRAAEARAHLARDRKKEALEAFEEALVSAKRAGLEALVATLEAHRASLIVPPAETKATSAD